MLFCFGKAEGMGGAAEGPFLFPRREVMADLKESVLTSPKDYKGTEESQIRVSVDLGKRKKRERRKQSAPKFESCVLFLSRAQTPRLTAQAPVGARAVLVTATGWVRIHRHER